MQAPFGSTVKIVILALMWIISLLGPVYGAIYVMYVDPTDRVSRAAAFFPTVIQLVVLFAATAIMTSITQIRMMRHFAAVQASQDQHHIRTHALMDKAIKTAALQFSSTSCLQVFTTLPVLIH